ncbi:MULTISPECIES: hypothetical protein [Paracoccus]|uniref:Uncharacterized protein n=1 Tax=Paracoccus versutus TaxID=34007 RepID=A0A3D9XAL1_PARVE|nr:MULTISPECIES: hypothetical protein [Paracoccus]REF67606.1 hypothetical protein BDD41_4636 [Paracoccus versutus]WGR58445.1 hypothetical protein E3U25_21270 [Paracoccus versutus]
MVFARYALVLLGLVLCGLGVAQVQPGVPGLFPPPSAPPAMAVPGPDAADILLGLGGLIGGLVCGLIALALAGPQPPPDRAPPKGATGTAPAGQPPPSLLTRPGAIRAVASAEVISACRKGRSITSSPSA